MRSNADRSNGKLKDMVRRRLLARFVGARATDTFFDFTGNEMMLMVRHHAKDIEAFLSLTTDYWEVLR